MSDEPRHTWGDRPDRQAQRSSNYVALTPLLSELEVLDLAIEDLRERRIQRDPVFGRLFEARRRVDAVRTLIGGVPPSELSPIVQTLIRQVRTMEDGQ